MNDAERRELAALRERDAARAQADALADAPHLTREDIAEMHDALYGRPTAPPAAPPTRST